MDLITRDSIFAKPQKIDPLQLFIKYPLSIKIAHSHLQYAIYILCTYRSPDHLHQVIHNNNPFSISAPRGPPTSITATALSPTSILLNWNLPLPEDRNGDITGYVINVTNLDNGTVLQFTTVLVSNFTLSTLKPFTVYISTISARTAVGVGPFSGVISVQTLEDGMCHYETSRTPLMIPSMWWTGQHLSVSHSKDINSPQQLVHFSQDWNCPH